MNDTSILLLALAIQQLLFAVGWGLHAGRIEAHRQALLHWSAFCAVSGLSLCLFSETARETFPDLAQFLRNAGLVLAFVVLRRGLLCFTRQPRRDREQMTLFGAYLAVLLLLGTGREMGVARTVVLSGVSSWLMLRAAIEFRRGAGAEFGRTGLAAVGAPIAVVGVVMAARAVMTLARPESGAVSITHVGNFNLGLLLTMAALLALFHFSLGFLVMQRMVTELEHLSSHDSLTRLFNRRAFEQRLAGEIAASQRAAAPLGLLLVDIDHFKRVNDRFGHPAGDAVLREVADRLAQAVRRSDVLARLGGEEFGVLLPSTDAAGIRQAAERLRVAVSGRAIDIGDTPLGVTVSVGASMRLSDETDPEAMLRRADQALYRAKAEGRDRTVFDTLAQVSEANGAAAGVQTADAV
ncbi:MAG: GGDEF domain-containing protein [Burkholderiaceae bacterium]